MKILSVVGARPNFMKIAPFIRAIESHNKSISPSPNLPFSPSPTSKSISHLLVHTGQHYDDRMSKAFFDDLEIPEADINLEIGSGTHAEQIGQTMIAFEKVLKAEKPDWVVVVGDVNATLACSVIAKKENIRCCHIEAGLRSGDMNMPEEINRLVTDRISDLLLAPDRLSVENLKAEGIPDSKIRFVGNVMIDTLEACRTKAFKLDLLNIVERNYHQHARGNRQEATSFLKPDNFCIVTLHRPSNVDGNEVLTSLVFFLINEVARNIPVLWPLHPRTVKRLTEFGLLDKLKGHPGIFLLEPLGYLEMLRLNMDAKLMLTDSGGLQEECTVLGTPCLTLRWNTERPVTLWENGGASILVGNNIDRIREEFFSALKRPRTPVRPELWDGYAAERCLEAIMEAEG
jgi:UDP-N-acetylglucosamine 2-epimerase (non-hydrolysing)